MTDPMLTYRGTVYPWHCDHVGHMNVMWYVGKFDEATWHFLHQIGLTPSYLAASHKGMVAVEQRFTYHRELRAGDVVSVRTVLNEVREKVLVFVHEMKNDETGEVAARGIMTAVQIDTSLRKSCAFAPEIAARARGLVVQSAPSED